MSYAVGILSICGGIAGIICGHIVASIYVRPDTNTASLLFYISILAIGGGIFSFKREMWSLALLGSISACFLFLFLVPGMPFFWAYNRKAVHSALSMQLLPAMFLGITTMVLAFLSRKGFK